MITAVVELRVAPVSQVARHLLEITYCSSYKRQTLGTPDAAYALPGPQVRNATGI